MDFIIGNPPFLGGKMLRRELGDAYVDRLFALWRDRVRPEADLCCYWFEKARAHIAAGKCKRAGLLATQGIRGGANRVAWAKSHLKKAGLVDTTKRGVYQITARGREVLAESPKAINLRFLYRFPEYQAFRATRRQRAEETEDVETNHESTPEEALEAAHAKTQENLSSGLIQRLKACSPQFFERLVVEVIVKMGYGGSRHDVGKAIGKSGDGGIDGIIKEDKLGLDAIYIQAKRWANTVGRPEIQKFVGALTGLAGKEGGARFRPFRLLDTGGHS